MASPSPSRDVPPERGRGVRRVRAALLTAIGVLYALSIPWYSAGDPSARLFGLPRWVGVALACYVAAAILNAVAWLITDVPDAPQEPER